MTTAATTTYCYLLLLTTTPTTTLSVHCSRLNDNCNINMHQQQLVQHLQHQLLVSAIFDNFNDNDDNDLTTDDYWRSLYYVQVQRQVTLLKVHILLKLLYTTNITNITSATAATAATTIANSNLQTTNDSQHSTTNNQQPIPQYPTTNFQHIDSNSSIYNWPVLTFMQHAVYNIYIYHNLY